MRRGTTTKPFFPYVFIYLFPQLISLFPSPYQEVNCAYAFLFPVLLVCDLLCVCLVASLLFLTRVRAGSARGDGWGNF